MLRDLDVRYANKRATVYKLAGGEGLHVLVRPNGSSQKAFRPIFADTQRSRSAV